MTFARSSRAESIYTYSVWARDASSLGTTSKPLGRWDAYAALQYTLTTTCTAVTASSSLSEIAAAGTAVTITGAATGCPHSQYEFLVLYPGSHTWLVAQYYSCGATYSSNTAGEPKGTYTYSVGGPRRLEL